MIRYHFDMRRGVSIPYYKREEIAKEYHLGPKPMGKIRKENNIGKLMMWEITREFPPSHFMGIKDRPNRQFLMITQKLRELVEQKNEKAIQDVAKVLSKY